MNARSQCQWCLFQHSFAAGRSRSRSRVKAGSGSRLKTYSFRNLVLGLGQVQPRWKMTSSSETKTAICLFRNDLRVLDNETLHLANATHSQVLPLYCFDPRHFKGTYHFGFPKTAYHRAKFLIESVSDLRKNLQSRGSDLIVRIGQPEDVILDIVKSANLGPDTNIFLQKEVTNEELDVEKAIKNKTQLKVNTVWGQTLYHIEDLPFQPKRLPDIYTQFRKRVEEIAPVRKCFSMPDHMKPLQVNVDAGVIPSLPDLGLEVQEQDSRSAFPFTGGEASANERLRYYLWVSDNVSTYKETRNGMVGSDYSTKFSSWLAHGCISPRQIYWEIKKYEKERTSNQSTYWVIFELLWRDYFHFVAFKFGNLLFRSSGIKGGNVHWKTNEHLFKAWQEGRTGVPYVDANMRELAKTGFMSNRGRQNVASFLTKDLDLDWRLGAEWFESQLIDHDVCSNYGNWQYVAGVGNDPNETRKFNVIKQGLDYDGNGDYVRLWVPELDGIKTGSVHYVWTLGQTSLESGNVVLGQNYPTPIVTAPEWQRHMGRQGSGSASRGGQQSRGRGKGRQGDNRERSAQYSGQKRGLDFYFKNSNPR